MRQTYALQLQTLITDLYKQNLIYQYYQFKSYLLLNEIDMVRNEYNKLKLVADENYQLSNIQKAHLLKIAQFDLNKHNIVFY